MDEAGPDPQLTINNDNGHYLLSTYYVPSTALKSYRHVIRMTTLYTLDHHPLHRGGAEVQTGGPLRPQHSQPSRQPRPAQPSTCRLTAPDQPRATDLLLKDTFYVCDAQGAATATRATEQLEGSLCTGN